jgi:hypothetical protein
MVCVVASRLNASFNPGTASQSNIAQPDIACAGLIYHQRSGVYFARARVYGSGPKRWMNRDPNGESKTKNGDRSPDLSPSLGK